VGGKRHLPVLIENSAPVAPEINRAHGITIVIAERVRAASLDDPKRNDFIGVEVAQMVLSVRRGYVLSGNGRHHLEFVTSGRSVLVFYGADYPVR